MKMNRNNVNGQLLCAVLLLGFVSAAQGVEQTWNLSGIDDIWSTNKANWDASSVWTNGNSAVFGGSSGESVDISADVTVGNITFQADGYEIADSDTDGTLSLSGSPSVIAVVNAGDTATISEVVAGNGGLTKTGPGELVMKSNNSYFGETTVSAGILRLEPGNLYALGATGTGNNTVVADGATIDFNGCYSGGDTAEKFIVSGDGVDGLGCLVNNGANHINNSLEEVSLTEDATIGGPRRIDINNLVSSQKTLTKSGDSELAVRTCESTEIIIEGGKYTLLGYDQALGGDSWGDTIVNGGTLYCWSSLSVPERVIFNGGDFAQGATNQQFTMTGHVTFNGVARHTSPGGRGVKLSGFLDGAGGFQQSGDGWLYVTGATNTYSGATIINSGKKLWVGGTTPGSDGILGSSAVTNYGYLYANSPLLTEGSVVNSGTVYANYGELASGEIRNYNSLYVQGGVLGTGSVYNSGTIFFDNTEPCVISNAFSGNGAKYVRYGADVIICSGVSTGGIVRTIEGSLTFTNGSSYTFTDRFNITDRQYSYYPSEDLGPMTSVVNVTEGAILNINKSEFGNGVVTSNWIMKAVLNQYGGVVRTYGTTEQDNGIRIAHWPQARGTYNMMGGLLVIDNGYDLGIATDGIGMFHQTGGEVYTSRVMVNERIGSGGFGTLTVEGGVLNIGLTNGILNIEQNGIMIDSGAPYEVNYGGAGGVIRAVTNFVASVDATLYGSGSDAITFDTQEWDVDLSGDLSGDGGLNKSGSGTLIVSGDNTYTGVTQVLEGTLRVDSATALPDGGEVLFGVAAGDAGGRLHSNGDLDLSGIIVGVANPGDLVRTETYTIATYDWTLTGMVGSYDLPSLWHVSHDPLNKSVKLIYTRGTVIIVR